MRNAQRDHALSPLDQIRQAEAEVTARLAGAREAAAQHLARIRNENQRIIAEAEETGRREGEAAYQDAIAAAEEEARLIRAAGQQQAVELKILGAERMTAAVEAILDRVLGGLDKNEC